MYEKRKVVVAERKQMGIYHIETVTDKMLE